ncbi:hypothetical protein IE81DRAFT_220670 [Ceraceosorus guamensis]|uniref:Uncharacterized protein n=1 Tax=Ceraceosorus guamensis TaxID=1522189 RepID=A0A316VS65_9BASI|nr:hypothetical protein IE81DRAFT_220670 [Ceraceosorus guamensis]PWN40437.1 hypothetical protein IE81DRAFT_220670 [Ceraceosorus guamensis]
MKFRRSRIMAWASLRPTRLRHDRRTFQGARRGLRPTPWPERGSLSVERGFNSRPVRHTHSRARRSKCRKNCKPSTLTRELSRRFGAVVAASVVAKIL